MVSANMNNVISTSIQTWWICLEKIKHNLKKLQIGSEIPAMEFQKGFQKKKYLIKYMDKTDLDIF